MHSSTLLGKCGLDRAVSASASTIAVGIAIEKILTSVQGSYWSADFFSNKPSWIVYFWNIRVVSLSYVMISVTLTRILSDVKKNLLICIRIIIVSAKQPTAARLKSERISDWHNSLTSDLGVFHSVYWFVRQIAQQKSIFFFVVVLSSCCKSLI